MEFNCVSGTMVTSAPRALTGPVVAVALTTVAGAAATASFLLAEMSYGGVLMSLLL